MEMQSQVPVALDCNPSYFEPDIRGLQFEASLGKEFVRHRLQNNQIKWTASVASVVKCLHCKLKALSPNMSHYPKKNKIAMQ
jgi:hypothetical protein